MSYFKIARVKKGLTQKQLREMLKDSYSIGISPNTLIEIERGNYTNVKFGTIEKLSKILEVSIEELFLKV